MIWEGIRESKGAGNSLDMRPPNLPLERQHSHEEVRAVQTGKILVLSQPAHLKPILQALYNIQNRPTVLRSTFPSSIANIHDNKSVINSGTNDV